MQDPTSQRWLDQLDEYGVECVILDLQIDSDLVRLFQRQPAWTVDFEDGQAVIFARDTAASTPDFGSLSPNTGRTEPI